MYSPKPQHTRGCIGRDAQIAKLLKECTDHSTHLTLCVSVVIALDVRRRSQNFLKSVQTTARISHLVDPL